VTLIDPCSERNGQGFFFFQIGFMSCYVLFLGFIAKDSVDLLHKII